MEKEDIEDVQLARPVAVIDLWNLDDRISRLEDLVERLARLIHAIALLQKEDRVSKLEAILTQEIDRRDRNGKQKI